MGLKSRIVGRGKQLVQNPAVMRWVSDDRVMKAAEGVLDARTRVKLAWHMLKNGHGLPAVDPALDDSLGETIEGGNGKHVVNGKHAANGAAHVNGKNGWSGADASAAATNGSYGAHAAADGEVSARPARKNGHANGG